MSGVILNRSQPNFAAKSVANGMYHCYAWKPCSDQRWQDKLRFSTRISRFFEQSSFVNIHLLCYWPTIHNSISKICPRFQAINSHIFEIDELLNEHWAKIVQSENISTPIYVECDKMYRSKVCVQEFSYFVSGLDIQLEQSKNNSPICKKNPAVAGGKIRRLTYSFFE